jgi:DNA-binding response OmpR family regulator
VGRRIAAIAGQEITTLACLGVDQADDDAIGMPRRDGYELILELRRRGVTTPAAALTAFARSEDRTRALCAGYQAHVTKPVEPHELVATVVSLSARVV